MSEESEAPLRLGVVGCGRIVERGYLQAAAASSLVEIVAVADLDLGRRERVSAAAGAAACADADHLLDHGVQALVVAVPATSHAAIVQRAAAAGIPSLVEKPPALAFADAAAMAALVPPPSFAFNRRFLQGREMAASIPAEGWLEFDLELSFRQRDWGAHVCDDDALLDAGVHLIDLAAFLSSSQPIAVRSAVVRRHAAELELELGRARARIRCATDRGYLERMEVRDRSGRVVASSRIDRVRATARRLLGRPDPLVGSLQLQLDRFADRVGGGNPGPLASASDAVSVMSVVEACRRSAELDGAELTVLGSPV